MSGSQDSGIATASSTAAPKDMASSAGAPAPLPPKKMTLHSTSVSKNSSAMTIWLMRPRSVMPTAIQTRISAPMTTHHTHGPTFRIPLVASAPS